MKIFILMIVYANLAIVFGFDLSSGQACPSPLACAIANDQGTIARELIESNYEILNTKIDGDLPIHIAARNNRENIVEYIIGLRPDMIDVKNDNGETPLFLTVSNNGPHSLVRYLINKGADVNTKDKYDRTPLYMSAKYGDKDSVELLIENYADVNIADKFGTTPLHFAARFGRKNIAKFLMKNKANANARDNENNTPCDLIKKKDRETMSLILKCRA